jgi:hypothetical protein
LVFVDLEKAYDMIPRKLLWPVISKMGIPHEILVGAEKLQAKNKAHVKIGNRVSGFKTTKGLKQRCGLSPTLFRFISQVYCMTGIRSAKVWNCQERMKQ